MTFVGIDLGTSGCRAIAINADEMVLADTRISYTNNQAQTPELWWQSTLQVLKTLIPKLPEPHIDAICVDGTSSSLLLCSPSGSPKSPVMMYFDNAPTDCLDKITAHSPVDAVVNSTSSSLAKAIKLSEQASNPYIILHQADWVIGKLCNVWQSDENNALKLGYDPLNRQWPDWIGHILPNDSLPVVLPPGEPLQTLTAALTTELKLLSPPMVCSGTADSTAAFIATGAKNKGDAVTSLGSTLVTKILSDHPINQPDLGVYSHRLNEHWIVGGSSNTGGKVLQQHFSNHDIVGLSRQIKPNTPTKLDYYPLPSIGERFPSNNPQKQPILSPKPCDPVIFLQGILEGITNIEAEGYQLLHKLGCPQAQRIFTVGGGSKNMAWTQIREQKLQLTMATPKHSEAAFGTAILAKNGWQKSL